MLTQPEQFPRTGAPTPGAGPRPASLTPSSPATGQASPSTSGKGTPVHPSWTLPSGPLAAAGSASRSRAASSRWRMASGT